jgi:hypothetical protein
MGQVHGSCPLFADVHQQISPAPNIEQLLVMAG